MKNIIEKKKENYKYLLIALVIGGLVGFFASKSTHQQSSNQQSAHQHIKSSIN